MLLDTSCVQIMEPFNAHHAQGDLVGHTMDVHQDIYSLSLEESLQSESSLSQLKKKRGSYFCCLGVLSSVGVLSLFGMPTDSTFLAHSNRFFLSSMVLWMPFVALGTQRLLRLLSNRTMSMLTVLILVPIGLMALNISVAGRFDTRMNDWLAHSCRVLPSGQFGLCCWRWCSVWYHSGTRGVGGL